MKTDFQRPLFRRTLFLPQTACSSNTLPPNAANNSFKILTYRPEIDGLRALAVLSVIFYHAGLNVGGTTLLKGGFLGVDVFFVISGYLITSIILAETKKGTFSFSDFYERRCRRILPALFVVIAASIPFAWTRMLPDAMRDYSGSLLATFGFASNIWFWQEDSYIAHASQLKPFLHTWSLSVEEQFYLLFPAVLLILWKFAKNHVTMLITLTIIASLIYADYESSRHSDGAFYLLPTRAWELLAGALLAQLEGEERLTPSPIVSQIMSAVGLCLILVSLTVFDDKIKHPSFYTAIPVIGSMMIIWFANHRGSVTALLQNQLISGIGLLSYSLYLWHFPVLAFACISNENLTNHDKINLIVITFILSAITYFFVEKPFRNKKAIARSSLVVILISAFLMLSGFSVYAYRTNGVIDRLTGPTRTAYEDFKTPEYRRLVHPKVGTHIRDGMNGHICALRDPRDACVFGDGRFVTLGDSHIGHYEKALIDMLSNLGHGLISFNYEECPFVDSSLWFRGVAECSYVNEQRLRIISRYDEQKIFLISANEGLFKRPKRRTSDPVGDGRKKRKDGESVEPYIAYQSYKNKILWLLEKGHKVVLIYSLPYPGMNVKKHFFNLMRSRDPLDGSPIDTIYTPDDTAFREAESADALLELDEHPNLIKVYPRDILCSKKSQRKCLIMSPEGPLFFGGRHLSVIGARLILEEIMFRLGMRRWL